MTMKRNQVIYIQKSQERTIVSAIRRFCLKESGKGVKCTINLYRLKQNGWILDFLQPVSMEIICDLLYRLHSKIGNGNNPQLRAYFRNDESGLPQECMVYLDKELDYIAVDPQGNSYEQNIESESFTFKPREQKERYVPCSSAPLSQSNCVQTFQISEARPTLWQWGLSRLLDIKEFIASIDTVNGFVKILIFVLWIYSGSLSLRTYENIDGFFWFRVLGSIIIALPFAWAKKDFGGKVLIAFMLINIAIYLPNYHLSRFVGEHTAVIEKIYHGGRHYHTSRAKLHYTNDNSNITLYYCVDKSLMHVGDTCILEEYKGLWGFKVIRGVKCNDVQVWRK